MTGACSLVAPAGTLATILNLSVSSHDGPLI